MYFLCVFEQSYLWLELPSLSLNFFDIFQPTIIKHPKWVSQFKVFCQLNIIIVMLNFNIHMSFRGLRLRKEEIFS